MDKVSTARLWLSARIRAAVAPNGHRHDPLAYGLVFDVDQASGVTIRPAARPVLADLGPQPRFGILRSVRAPGKSGRTS
jgi:hypothetical protein